MKKKFLLPILSVCMVVALVSVGFAAWLITGNDATDTEAGSFVTHNVTNEYFTVTIAKAESETAAINFGKKDDTSITNPWFQFDNDVGDEKLTAKFTVTITPDEKESLANIKSGYKITVTLKANDSTYDTLEGKKYVAYPTLAGASNTASIAATKTLQTDGVTLTIDGSSFGNVTGDTAATVEVTVTFDWGDFFKKDGAGAALNPYVYFNGLTGGANGTNGELTNRAVAKTVMREIYTLNTKNYTLSLGVEKNS